MSTSFLIDTQSTTTLSLVLDSLVSLSKGRRGALKMTHLSARQNGVFHAFSWTERGQSIDLECIRGLRGAIREERVLMVGGNFQLWDATNGEVSSIWGLCRGCPGSPVPVSEDA